jgi:glyoxylase-like metal-dependent hydrolase (beta-lactamase superfamily II)
MNLDVKWIHGSPSKKNTDPPIQVHAYDQDTFILRQSKAVNFEAPFMFLLFGDERAILLDTGATTDPEKFPLRKTVDGLTADWLAANPHPDYELVVAHTHGHGDHVAGDTQFADRPATKVVAREPEAVQEFFGFDAWPDQTVEFDLGGRVLSLIGSPGHHNAAITVYDPRTGLLFTGDTVYPGRLYAFDFPEFIATLDRVMAFVETHPVTHVLGCHIEMTLRPRRDYVFANNYQPNEPPLQMSVAQLGAVRDAAHAVVDRPGVHKFDDFIIYNGVSRNAQRKLLLGSKLHKIGYRRRG